MRALKWMKWTFIVTLVVILGSLLHYTLPRSEVVRVVGVTERLETLGWNSVFYARTPSGQSEGSARDVRLVETVRPGGRELVFRNEDTGWVWPPYLKFNSADMQARARDQVSTSDDPVWVVVSYYGVRSLFLSIYPNVLQIKPAEGPEERLVPWTRIIFFTLLFAGAVWVWFMLSRRKSRSRDTRDDDLSDADIRDDEVRDDVVSSPPVRPQGNEQTLFGRFLQRWERD